MIPKGAKKTAMKIQIILRYMITISQKKLCRLYPLYKKPNFCFTIVVDNLSFSLFMSTKTVAGIPRDHMKREGPAT